jgi:hypothetical protein
MPEINTKFLFRPGVLGRPEVLPREVNGAVRWTEYVAGVIFAL